MLRNFVGWILVISGLLLMVSPFISGFTSFFILSPLSITAHQPNFDLTSSVIGFSVAMIGYYLIRPSRTHIFS